MPRISELRRSERAFAPPVDDPRLGRILFDIYPHPDVYVAVGSGKVTEALAAELRTGRPTRDRYHPQDAANLFRALSYLLHPDPGPWSQRPATKPLSPPDRATALSEAHELWETFQLSDDTGAVSSWLAQRPERLAYTRSALKQAVQVPELSEVTGATFEKRPNGRPTVTDLAPRSGLAALLLDPMSDELAHGREQRRRHEARRLGAAASAGLVPVSRLPDARTRASGPAAVPAGRTQTGVRRDGPARAC